METLAYEERLPHDGPFQVHWYALVARLIGRGRTVLDVGAGSGAGLSYFVGGGATDTMGIDPFPLGPRVHRVPIDGMKDRSWDIVTAFDVIEHVEEDRAFLANLLRVGRSYVFLSTPNWNRSHAENEFHVREYTPAELRQLLAGLSCRWWTSDDDCIPHERYEIPDDCEDANFGVLVTL